VRKKPYLNIIFILEINVCIKQYFKLRAVILRICSYKTNFFVKTLKKTSKNVYLGIIGGNLIFISN